MLNTKPSNLPEKSKSDMPAIEGGTYPARIVKLIYLGKQEEEKYGEPGTMVTKPKLMVFFEVPSEAYEVTLEDGSVVSRARTLIKEFPVPDAYNEKSGLIMLFEAVCSKDEGYDDMLGRGLLAEIGHTKTGNPKIVRASKPIKGMTIPDATSDLVCCLDFDAAKLADLPEFIVTKINERVGD